MDNELNKRIAQYRRLKGYSQKQVADFLGLKPSTYAQRERIGNITVDFLRKLAPILEVDLNYLILGENAKVVPPTLPDNSNKPDHPYPFFLDRNEKEIITLYRNVSSKSKIEIFEFAYQKFKNKL